MSGEFTDSFALIGADGRLVYWDDGFAQEFKFAEPLLKPGAKYADIVRTAANNPDTREFMLENSGFGDIDSLVRDGLKGFGKDGAGEYRSPGGRIILVHQHRTASGDIRRFARDVTAEKDAGERLTRAFRRLDSGDAASSVVLTETRRAPDGQYFYQPIDEPLRRLLELPADCVGQDAMVLFARMSRSPEERARNGAELEAAAVSLRNVEQDYQIRDGRDRMRWLRHSMMPRREADGTIIFSGLIRDVTREKEAEDALAEARQRLQAVDSDAHTVLIEFHRTPDGNYVFPPISEGVRRLLVLPADFVGQDIVMFFTRMEISAEDNLRFTAELEQSARMLSGLSQEYRIRDGENRMRWFRQSVMPRREADGTVIFSGTMRDVTREKEAEDALAQAQHRLDAVDSDTYGVLTGARRTPDGMYIFEPIPEGLCRLLDLPLELAGQDPMLIYSRFERSAEDNAKSGAMMEHAARTLDSFSQEYRIRDGKDRMRWLRQSFMPQREADGTVVFSGVIRDVTREKEAEDALTEAQHRLDAIDSDEYGVLTETRLTPDGTYIFEPISEGMRRLLDLPAELVGGDQMLVFSRFATSAEDNARYNAQMEHAARTLEGFSQEYHARDGKNRMRWLRHSMSLRRETDGTVVFSGVMRDITREKDAEDQVELLRSVVVRSSDAVVIFETAEHSTKILYVNAKFTELYGGSEESLVGQSMETLTSNDFKRTGSKLLSAALKRDDGLPFEYQAVGADGRVFWVEVRVQTVQKFGDGGVRWVVISRDVSERRHAQEELLRAKDEAEAGNRAKSEFLANMSHELRTPLNAIIGFTELIEQGVGRTGWVPSYLEYLSDVSQSGRHLLELINTILDLSKIEAGQLELNREPLDLGEVIRTSLTLVSGMARDGGIAMSVDAPPDCPEIPGDYLKLKQVLLNILSNAIKFTPPEGKIKVTLRFTRAAAEILVTDTGCGIPKADKDRVVLPFFQGASSLSRKFGGSGLGLSIARELCRLHGGKLAIASIEGEGTTVRISLPLKEKPIRPRTARSSRPMRTSPRLGANGVDHAPLGISAGLETRPRSAAP